MWEANAKYCAETFGTYVDWDERFYECPECGEPVYECDWESAELEKELCPICGFSRDDTFTPVFGDEELDNMFN